MFVGGFTLEAAESVCAQGKRQKVKGKKDDNTAPVLPFTFSLLPLLASLLDQSLLRQAEGQDGGPRFTMLETLREYALERLAAAGEEIDVRRRHAAYFAAWVEQAGPAFAAMSMITSERLGRELGNLRAALDWSLARPAEEDALYGLRLFGSIWELWWLRYPSRGRRDCGARAGMRVSTPPGSCGRADLQRRRAAAENAWVARRASRCSSTAWHWRGSMMIARSRLRCCGIWAKRRYDA